MIKFTVTSTKGGVGKTTLTANLGALLADMGLRVLLIDADVQPSLSKYFPLAAAKPAAGITEVMVRGELTSACITPTLYRNLDIVVSDDPEGNLPHWLLNRVDRGFRLRFALQSPAVVESYDCVLIDTQGAVGPLQDAAVLAADILVSPITPEILSAREFKDGTMELLERLEPGGALGATLSPMKVVIYRQDRTADACAVASGIRQDFIKLKGRVADRDRVAKEHLRDLTREKLADLIQASSAKVQGYSDKRSSVLALPANLVEAKALLKTAETAAAAARAELDEAETVFVQVQEHHAQCREGDAANTARLEQAKSDAANAAGRLEDERGRQADEVLRGAKARAEAAATLALDALKAAELSLQSAVPESAKAILDTSESTLKSARDQREEQERELLKLRTRLDLIGEQGLAEALAEAGRASFDAGDALERMLRCGRAARLLFDTLAAEREAMRNACVAPLREGIERLGRHVFGATLRTEVDENLRIVSRTINGVTVSLEQLSTGAREQMGLLVRLAVASIVSKDGGVPLVLDDALGPTDEARLETMGAVLRIASQDAQTIILTCAPERYAHVGAQMMVEM